MTPPSGGPSACPSPFANAQPASARARSPGGYNSARIAMTIGVTVALAEPWRKTYRDEYREIGRERRGDPVTVSIPVPIA